MDLERKWEFNAVAKKGDEVSSGQVIGKVQETETIEHRVMVPPNVSGKVKSIKSGTFNITETVCVLDDGTEIAMMQEWPVRHPRPFVQKYAPDVPLITGQRILDFLFPLAKGGTAGIPGPFVREDCNSNNNWPSGRMHKSWSTSDVEKEEMR